MKHVVKGTAVAVVAAGSLVAGQGRDANQLLAAAREALGGGKLLAVTTLSATGRTLRSLPNGNTVENEFELSMALPDKYLMRSVMAAMGTMSIYRNSGFNGSQVIEEIDRPPNLAAGGNVVIRIAGPGGTTTDLDKLTPEQRAEMARAQLLSNKREYVRLTLGMFAGSPAVYPLEFTDAGEAESGDGKADVIDVKGEGDFTVRLFLDASTHLPLMVSWMDREPLVMQMGGPAGGGAGGTGGTRVVTSGGGVAMGTWTSAGGGGGGNPATMSKEDREKFEQELEARRKEAEAKRRVVEYRVFYADYQEVGGVKLPHRIQRWIDGKTTEEMIFESFKVNPKIDARTFQVAK